MNNLYAVNEAREQFLAAQTALNEFIRANDEMNSFVEELQSVKQAIAHAEEEKTILENRDHVLFLEDTRMTRVKYALEDLEQRVQYFETSFP